MLAVDVDCHTHVWADHTELGPVFGPDYVRGYGEEALLSIPPEVYRSGTNGAKRTILLALKSRAIGLAISNERVIETVRRDPARIIGFGCVDPSEAIACEELRSFPDLGLMGLKLAPAYQLFHPWDDRAWPLYRTARDLGLPILWHQGSSFVQTSRLEECRPILLDRIALEFPDLVMVIAHMGYPWFEETIALCRKHRNVYADISALASRPFHALFAFSRAIEAGVWDKLLFGSDYPFMTTRETIDGLVAVQHRARDPFPAITDAMLLALLERDTLSVLGIAT